MTRIVKEYLWQMGLLLLILSCKVEQPVTTIDPESTENVQLDTLPEIEVVEPEPLVYHSSVTRLHDLLHTKLELSLNWNQQRIEGVATLHLKPYFYPQNNLILDAKNFNIHYVKMVKGMEKVDLDFVYDNMKLMISLDTVYHQENDFFIEIKYTGKPKERKTGGSEAIGSDQGLYFINHDGSDPNKPMQVWTQGETEANSCWFPTIDAPNERMTHEIYLTVDQRFTTLSNGDLIYSKFNEDSTRTDYWSMEKPHAPYLVMIAVGEFDITKDTWKDIPLTYYIEPAYADYAKDIFGATPEMMNFFSELIGMDYPWSKYAQIIVRDYISGAMENTTASLFYDAMLVDSRELLDYDFEGIIAHELFHQWFGNLVTCESWANLTLNEGFANYAEFLWNEHKYGKFESGLHNLEESEQYFEEAANEKKDLIRYNYDDKEDMFDSHSYAKGGRILHMLRNYVGDDAFFTALNRYLKKYQFKSTEIHDLRLVFEEVTGEDLNWFFNQWFLASGHPILHVEDLHDDSTLHITITQLQDISSTPVYRIPVKIDVWTKNQKTQFKVLIDKTYQTVEFPLEEAPQLVLFDSDQVLLAEIIHPKSQDEYIFQYRNTEGFLSKYQALDSLIMDLDDSLNWLVMTDALHDDFWYFRQMAINALEDYNGEKKQEIEKTLTEMARYDEKPQVRADALHTLYKLFGSKYQELFRDALSDSSYMVAGTAIYAYSTISPSEMAKVAMLFDEFNNVNIVIPLASFYIDIGGHEKYDWFVNKINTARSETLWYLLQYFGEYIMDASELMQRRAIVVLEKYARIHPKNYVRLSAYQSLGLLTDLSGVEELRKEIRENEEDKYLRQLYQSLP